MPVQKCTEKSSFIAKKKKTPKKHLHSLWATFAFLLLLKKQNKEKHPFCT